MDGQEKRLGMVTGGSLTKGLEVKLDSEVSVEDMAVGRYVAIQGREQRFFGMITDVALGALDQRLTITPPDITDEFIARVLNGTGTYGSLRVVPMLTTTLLDGPRPAKTVPPHFASVCEASETDIELIFGEDDEKHFCIGSPLDMEVKVNLNYGRLIERSNGIFGKSGTGKTYLTYIFLASIIQKSSQQSLPREKAVHLIFDMHSEYGWEGHSEGGSGKVRGLKQLYGSRVAIFALDEQSFRNRGISPDYQVQIPLTDIDPEDIEILKDTLNLTDLAVDAAYTLKRRLKKAWITRLLNEDDAEGGDADIEDLVLNGKIHEKSLENLRRGLGRLKDWPFISTTGASGSIKAILDYLDRGTNIVMEFGRYGDNLAAYVLVANLITRRIYDQYRRRVEQAMGDRAKEPYHLIITIEEAHKFLSPQVANQTIFGTIAREMRKYKVTLLVVDQRPSGIDEEVMSQVGTRITCLLDNDKDIESVLMGVSGKGELKSVLSKLETRQQALIFGHAVPMPVVIQTREYGSADSYREFGHVEGEEARAKAARDIQDMYG